MGACNVADLRRCQNLTFEGFHQLARGEGLTTYEKIGFLIAYRNRYERLIF
jgi:hypothetical protein